jgi:hypothetical protein
LEALVTGALAGQIGKLPSNLGLPVIKPIKLVGRPPGNVGTVPKNSGRRPR